VFAFGQTGSGKTHSMMGSAAEPGVVPRFAHDLFAQLFKRQVCTAYPRVPAHEYESPQKPPEKLFHWSSETLTKSTSGDLGRHGEAGTAYRAYAAQALATAKLPASR